MKFVLTRNEMDDLVPKAELNLSLHALVWWGAHGCN